jgi:hypothetical protein
MRHGHRVIVGMFRLVLSRDAPSDSLNMTKNVCGFGGPTKSRALTSVLSHSVTREGAGTLGRDV